MFSALTINNNFIIILWVHILPDMWLYWPWLTWELLAFLVSFSFIFMGNSTFKYSMAYCFLVGIIPAMMNLRAISQTKCIHLTEKLKKWGGKPSVLILTLSFGDGSNGQSHGVFAFVMLGAVPKLSEFSTVFLPNFKSISQILSKPFSLNWKQLIACIFWKERKYQNIYLRNKILDQTVSCR